MLTFLLLPVALSAEVVVFGDSWAEQSGAQLQDALRDAGYPYQVEDFGVGGTTATFWNDVAPTALVDAVAAQGNARWVWLSILGNDVFGYHATGAGAQAATANEAELREMLDRLHAAAPDVQVVSFGYDYPNFEQSTECVIASIAYFPDLVAAGTLSTYSVNRIFEDEVAGPQGRVDLDHPRFEALRLYGTLQLLGGAAAPNVWLPSPSDLMSDCIHPADAGYRRLHGRLVHAYWDTPAPTAAVSGAPVGPVCAGEQVVLSDASSGAMERLWSVNGVDAGLGPSLTRTVGVGVETVRLRAYAGAWHDDVSVVLEGVLPPEAVAGPDAAVCAGDAVALSVGGPGAVVWSPADGLDDPTSPTPRAAPTQTTTYRARLETAPGCADEAEVTVTVLPRPVAAIDGPTTLEVGEPGVVSVAADAGATVAWTVDGAAAPDGAVVFDDAGDHEVVAVVTSAEGCAVALAWAVSVTAAPTGPTADAPVDAPGCGCASGPTPWTALGAVAVLLCRRRAPRRS